MTTTMEDLTGRHEPAIDHDAKPNKVDLRAVHAREDAYGDPDLSSGSKVLLCRLIDLALNPDCHRPGPPGQVLIGQMKLATLIRRSERSVRAYTHELVAKHMIWTQLVPQTNTAPVYRYLLTRWIPEKQAVPDARGMAMIGNCRRRYNLIASDLNRDGTGKFRRFSGLIVNQYGKPILADFLENHAASGRALPVGAAKVAAGSGYGLPVGAANHSRSEGICSAAPSGKGLPLPAAESCRSQPPGASDLNKTQYESESSLSDGGAATPPPKEPGKATKADSWEVWVGTLKQMFPSKLEKLRNGLRQQLKQIQANPQNLDLAGAPLKKEAEEWVEYVRKQIIQLEADPSDEARRQLAQRKRELRQYLDDPRNYQRLALLPPVQARFDLLKRKILTVTEVLEGPTV